MSTDTDPEVSDRQRGRAFRRQNAGKPATERAAAPTRQRRPALAALAVVLIVGGALVAGLLAVRLDSREPVLVARSDIDAGSVITADDLTTANVASDGLDLIPESLAGDLASGRFFASGPITAGTLINRGMLDDTDPLVDGRAIVSVPLSPTLTPAGALRSGDIVSVVGVSTGEGGGDVTPLTEAFVLDVNQGSSEELGDTQSGSVTLLVPDEVAAAVIDAAGRNVAGLAVLRHGASADDELLVEDDDRR